MRLSENIEIDDFLRISPQVAVITKQVNVAVYDFDFRRFFHAESLHDTTNILAFARVGAPSDYGSFFAELQAIGITLVNSPAEHFRASSLPSWYPLLTDLTPRSLIYATPPAPESIESRLGWPVFIKGERQTTKHDASMAIARSSAEFAQVMERWKKDSILRWQKIICREYIPLLPTGKAFPGKLPPSFEFRAFVWHSRIVALGPYWTDVPTYVLTAEDTAAVSALIADVALRLQVPFLVVDVGKTLTGKWILIEVNDAQESGYASISPFSVWQEIVQIEAGEAHCV